MRTLRNIRIRRRQSERTTSIPIASISARWRRCCLRCRSTTPPVMWRSTPMWRLRTSNLAPTAPSRSPNVSLSRPDDNKPSSANLTGDIKLNGNAAMQDRSSSTSAGGHATATVHANSLQPLSANYTVNIDNVQCGGVRAEPSRGRASEQPRDERNAGAAPELAVKVKATSSERRPREHRVHGSERCRPRCWQAAQSSNHSSWALSMARSRRAEPRCSATQPKFALNLSAHECRYQERAAVATLQVGRHDSRHPRCAAAGLGQRRQARCDQADADGQRPRRRCATANWSG